MEGLLVVVGLALLAVPVLLVVALVAIGGLKRRVAALEAALAMREPAVAREVRATAATVPVPVPAPPSARAPGPAPAPIPTPTRVPAPVPARAAIPREAASAPPAPAAHGPAPAASDIDPPAEGALASVFRRARGWFTTGNVPVKIGMVVLFAGVAALLDYASDQGWLRLPLAWRLSGVGVAATAALALGWRQRLARPAFARALQGGAIGILLLVVFAASRRYGLMPTGVAFAASVGLVALLCGLAVLQGARSLAVLGILAGFLAPLWLSTGSGDHVALFSYYALLNVGIVAIAWYRPWRELLLLGFAFTWGIGVAWGVLAYDAALRASVQPFLLLFFALYLAMPLLQARRRGPRDVDRIDGTLLFGTPLVALSLQAALLDGARMPLAACALAMAALYAALARTLAPRPRYASLAAAHAVLAVGFATLAVPLALSAQATAAVFAVEGAALAWLGLRQGRVLPQWSGAALQLAAAAFGIGEAGTRDAADLLPFAHPRFVGGLLLALAGLASAWLYRRHARAAVAAAFFCWGLAWWCGTGLHEIARGLPMALRADAQLAFAAVTAWLLAEAHRRWTARGLLLVIAAAHAAAVPLAFAQAAAHTQPFAGAGIAAWAAFALLGLRGLACIDAAARRHDAPGAARQLVADGASLVPLAWWLAWPVALSLLGASLAMQMGEGWRWAAVALPWLALGVLAQARWAWLARAGAATDALRTQLLALVMAVLAAGWVGALWSSGDSAPLPWLPLVNPLALAQIATLGLAARWWRAEVTSSGWQRGGAAVWAAALLALATAGTLRAVHQLGDVPWEAALVATAKAQTALTVAWSVLGVAAWIIGSRRGQRALWLQARC